MAENRPPNRPAYNRARPGDTYPNDRERANKARQAAEALFAPKPRVVEAPVSTTRPAVENQVSTASKAPSPPIVRSEPAVARNRNATLAATRNRNEEFAARKIPVAHIARIRTWLKYGVKIAEVAQIYGVEIEDIERALSKP